MAKRAAEKLLSEVIRERRATGSYEPIPVHGEDLKKILQEIGRASCRERV